MKINIGKLICYFIGHNYERTYNHETDNVQRPSLVGHDSQTGQIIQAYQYRHEHKCSRCDKIEMIWGDNIF